jgi:hypothetical protein
MVIIGIIVGAFMTYVIVRLARDSNAVDAQTAECAKRGGVLVHGVRENACVQAVKP